MQPPNDSSPSFAPTNTVTNNAAPAFSAWRGVVPTALLLALCAVGIGLDNSHRADPPPLAQTPETATPPQAETAFLNNLLAGQAPAPLSAPVRPSPAGKTPPVLAAAPTPSPQVLASPGKEALTRGETALRERKLEAARAAFEEALKLDPKLAPAHLHLAQFAAAANDARTAQSHLEAAAQLSPNDPAPRLQLAQLFVATRQAAKAESAAREAAKVARGPQRRFALGTLAQILEGTNKPQAALQIWAGLAKADAKDGEAALAATLLADKLKKPADAKKYFAQALKAPVTNPEVTLTLARILAAQRKAAEANRLLVTGTKKFPNHIALHGALAELQIARGDAKGSIATLRGILSRVPAALGGGAPKVELHLALARALASTKQFKSANDEAQKALKLQPKNPAPVAFLAELAMARGDAKGSLAALRRVLQLDPKNHEARRALAQVLLRTGQTAQAQKELETYLKAEPKDLEAVAGLAAMHERAGRTQQALNLWQKVAAQVPKNPGPALEQARIFAKLGQEEKALERFRYVLQIAPGEPNALLGAARLEEKRGDDARALSHLKALIEKQPKFEPAYASLIRVAKKQDQMPATINFLKQQLAKNPDRRAAYAAILEHYESLGQAETGRSFVKSFIDKNPKLPAPRLAIDAFDLRRAQDMLENLEKKDASKASDKPGDAPATPDKPAEDTPKTP